MTSSSVVSHAVGKQHSHRLIGKNHLKPQRGTNRKVQRSRLISVSSFYLLHVTTSTVATDANKEANVCRL